MKKNPVVDKNAGPVPGLDVSIAFPSGVQRQEMEMPSVSMTPNDGDNPSISDAPFANGSDGRSFSGGPNSNPNPGKPGA